MHEQITAAIVAVNEKLIAVGINIQGYDSYEPAFPYAAMSYDTQMVSNHKFEVSLRLTVYTKYRGSKPALSDIDIVFEALHNNKLTAIAVSQASAIVPKFQTSRIFPTQEKGVWAGEMNFKILIHT